MTAATTTAKRAYKSGFCGLGSPAASHARCNRTYGHEPHVATCACTCHDKAEEPAMTIEQAVDIVARFAIGNLVRTGEAQIPLDMFLKVAARMDELTPFPTRGECDAAYDLLDGGAK